ncbi:MAG: hypothetical protein OXC82_14030, partial [Rhodobacteraceae bacterium]|nr:hypothetical protein [Paracoccaceae bacterium]
CRPAARRLPASGQECRLPAAGTGTAVGPDNFLEPFSGGFLGRKHVAELNQTDSLAVRLAWAVPAGHIDSPFRINMVANFILARVIIPEDLTGFWIYGTGS